jgi:translocator protein
MGELASKQQLRMSFLRWAAVTVPAIVFVGILMGQASNSGFANAWFVTLERPSWFPPGAAFGIAWTVLYVLIGLAVAMILDARRARGRARALWLFWIQLALNLSWSPLFFGSQQVTAALWLMVVLCIVATATTIAFWRIRRVAGLLMLPYLAWLGFATALNFEMDRLNPDAETTKPKAGTEFAI